MKKILLLSLLSALTFAHAQQIRTGEDVLRAMHDRYQSSWYQTLTFTQKSTAYQPDGTSSSTTWYEASSIPGKLRIDIGSPQANTGYLFVNGTLTVFKDGKLKSSQPLYNMLLVLGFDVYRQDPATTIKIVKDEGFDLSKLREDQWEGKPVYVVGASGPADLTSRQFWVTKDNLLFVREIEPSQSDPAKLDDVRFLHYQPLGHAWIAASVEVYTSGKKVWSEDYSDIQADPKLPAGLFDPAQFTTVHWEK